MQYQFTERLEYIKTIEFLSPGIGNPDPSLALHVEKIRYFQEEGVTGTITKREFSYSWDNNIWSNWNTLTLGNLTAISFRDHPNFYLKLKYTRSGIASGNIQRWYLIYDELYPTPPSPPLPPGCDCSSFAGEGPEYYLDRTNHTGPFSGLDVENYGIGDASIYEGRTDTSAGTTFRFREIKGAGGAVVTTEASSGAVLISVDASGVQSTYQNPNPVLKTVGGIDTGETFFDPAKSFAETMQAIFYPTLYPSFQNPQNFFSHNVANLQEIAASISVTFTSTLNRGTINPAYGTNGFRCGLGNTVYYTGSGLPPSVGSYPVSPNINTVSGYTVLIGTQLWTSAWAYDAGQQPLDSNGDPYNSPWPAQTSGYVSASFEGVYALYGTTSTISNPDTKQALASMLTGNNIVFSLVAQPSASPKQSFDIPDEWTGAPTNRPLIGLEQFNTLTSTWDSILLSQWVTSSVTHGAINYTRYTWNGDPIGARQIRLKF